MGKNRSVAKHILNRLKVIEDKLDGLSYKFAEAEVADGESEIPETVPATEDRVTESPEPNHSRPDHGRMQMPNYPNYPWMSGRPNPYYGNRWMAQYPNPSIQRTNNVEETKEEEPKTGLDVGTLISLMNDPLVKQVIGYFKGRRK
jgi:hypothetical protein